MNWRVLLVLAKGLAGQPFEASQRTAVNRAYYGAFNLARRWLEANVTPIDNRRAHEQVWETFGGADAAGEGNRSKWRSIGRLGGSLHLFRNQVDYDDHVDLDGEAARRAVETAERIVRLLAELELASPNR